MLPWMRLISVKRISDFLYQRERICPITTQNRTCLSLAKAKLSDKQEKSDKQCRVEVGLVR